MGDGPRRHPLLADLNLPPLGMETRGNPLVTADAAVRGAGRRQPRRRRRRRPGRRGAAAARDAQAPRVRQGHRRAALGGGAADPRADGRADDLPARGTPVSWSWPPAPASTRVSSPTRCLAECRDRRPRRSRLSVLVVGHRRRPGAAAVAHERVERHRRSVGVPQVGRHAVAGDVGAQPRRAPAPADEITCRAQRGAPLGVEPSEVHVGALLVGFTAAEDPGFEARSRRPHAAGDDAVRECVESR